MASYARNRINDIENEEQSGTKSQASQGDGPSVLNHTRALITPCMGLISTYCGTGRQSKRPSARNYFTLLDSTSTFNANCI